MNAITLRDEDVHGSILEVDAQVIVNAANGLGLMGGAVRFLHVFRKAKVC